MRVSRTIKRAAVAAVVVGAGVSATSTARLSARSHDPADTGNRCTLCDCCSNVFTTNCPSSHFYICSLTGAGCSSHPFTDCDLS
jgi:hypothetical protein